MDKIIVYAKDNDKIMDIMKANQMRSNVKYWQKTLFWEKQRVTPKNGTSTKRL